MNDEWEWHWRVETAREFGKKTDLSDVNGMIGSKVKAGNHSQKTQTAVTALS
jgi:hypothetical protein